MEGPRRVPPLSPLPGLGLQKPGLSARGAGAIRRAVSRGDVPRKDWLRRLGDKVKDKWQEPVIDGGPCGAATIPVGAARRSTTR